MGLCLTPTFKKALAESSGKSAWWKVMQQFYFIPGTFLNVIMKTKYVIVKHAKTNELLHFLSSSQSSMVSTAAC